MTYGYQFIDKYQFRLSESDRTAESGWLTTDDDSFSSVLSSAMNMVSETNDLQNNAQSEVIRFALGQSENTHDLTTAQYKALTAIQYTVAVRDKMIDAYKEIMNMQI